MNPLDFIQRDLVGQAIVELRRARRFMPGNPRRRLLIIFIYVKLQ
jgi:hypothetical protein